MSGRQRPPPASCSLTLPLHHLTIPAPRPPAGGQYWWWVGAARAGARGGVGQGGGGGRGCSEQEAVRDARHSTTAPLTTTAAAPLVRPGPSCPLSHLTHPHSRKSSPAIGPQPLISPPSSPPSESSTRRLRHSPLLRLLSAPWRSKRWTHPGGRNRGLGSGKGTHFSIPLQGSGDGQGGREGKRDNLKFFPDTFFSTNMWTSPDPYLTLSCSLGPSLPGFHSLDSPLAHAG